MEYNPRLGGPSIIDPARLVYFSLPLFNKSEEECVTKLDKWLYLIKNMENMTRMPWADDPIFTRLAQEGAIENLSREEYEKYEHIIDDVKITLGAIKMNREEGREEGRKEGRKEGREEGMKKGMKKGMEKGAESERRQSILDMRAVGIPDEKIAEIRKLPLDYVKSVN